MKRLFAISLCALALVGCQTEDKDKFSRQIQINSVPDGAQIIMDGFKLGKAPIYVGVETNEVGCFVRKTMITAIPQKDSYHTQVISFPPFNANDPDKSTAPESITFYMERNPVDGNSVILNED